MKPNRHSKTRCGQERFRSIAKSYFRRADGVVLMYDCSDAATFESIKEWLHMIDDSNDKKIPIVIIGNKIDLRETNRANKRVIEYAEGLKLAQVNTDTTSHTHTHT